MAPTRYIRPSRTLEQIRAIIQATDPGRRVRYPRIEPDIEPRQLGPVRGDEPSQELLLGRELMTPRPLPRVSPLDDPEVLAEAKRMIESEKALAQITTLEDLRAERAVARAAEPRTRWWEQTQRDRLVEQGRDPYGEMFNDPINRAERRERLIDLGIEQPKGAVVELGTPAYVEGETPFTPPRKVKQTGYFHRKIAEALSRNVSEETLQTFLRENRDSDSPTILSGLRDLIATSGELPTRVQPPPRYPDREPKWRKAQRMTAAGGEMPREADTGIRSTPENMIGVVRTRERSGTGEQAPPSTPFNLGDEVKVGGVIGKVESVAGGPTTEYPAFKAGGKISPEKRTQLEGDTFFGQRAEVETRNIPRRVLAKQKYGGWEPQIVRVRFPDGSLGAFREHQIDLVRPARSERAPMVEKEVVPEGRFAQVHQKAAELRLQRADAMRDRVLREGPEAGAEELPPVGERAREMDVQAETAIARATAPRVVRDRVVEPAPVPEGPTLPPALRDILRTITGQPVVAEAQQAGAGAKRAFPPSRNPNYETLDWVESRAIGKKVEKVLRVRNKATGAVEELPASEAVAKGIIEPRQTQVEPAVRNFEQEAQVAPKLAMNYTITPESGVLGKTISTFDAYWSGERNGTTGKPGRFPRGIPQEGQVFKLQQGDRQVLIRVTRVIPVDQIRKDANERVKWSQREGWKPERIDKEDLDGGYSIETETLATRRASGPWTPGPYAEAPAPAAARFEGHTVQTSQKNDYGGRTDENVAGADVTVALAKIWSAGEARTYAAAQRLKKPFIGVYYGKPEEDPYAARVPKDLFASRNTAQIATHIVEQLNAQGKPEVVVNFAGNGLSNLGGRTQEDANAWVRKVMEAVVNHPALQTKIVGVRSGGQTGIDIAAVKAARELGIPSLIHGAKGRQPNTILIRDAYGKDQAMPLQTYEQQFLGTPSSSGGMKALTGLLSAGALSQLLPSDDRTSQTLTVGGQTVDLGPVSEAGFGGSIGRILAGMKVPDLVGGPVTKQLLAEQSAPVRHEPTTPPGVRWRTNVTNVLDLVENYIPGIAQKRGLTAAMNPDELPENFIGPMVRGGMGISEPTVERLATIVGQVDQGGLKPHLSAYLTLAGSDRAWDVTLRKAAQVQNEIDRLYLAGNAAAARRLKAKYQTLFANITNNEVAPKGMTRADIADERSQLMAQMSPEQQALVRDAATSYYQVMDSLGDQLQKAGIWSKAEHAEFKARGSYIPMQRLMMVFDPANQELVQQHFLRGPKGEATRTRLALAESGLVEEMLGSTGTPINPLVQGVNFIEHAFNEIQRNNVARKMHQFFEKTAPDMKDVFYWQKVTADTPEPADGSLMKVAYLEDGKPQYFMVDRDLGQAMDSVDPEAISQALVVGKRMRMAFHAMAASANPAFALTQIVKDPLAAVIKPEYTRYQKGGLAKDLITKFLPTLARTASREWQRNMGDILSETLGVEVSGLRNKMMSGAYEQEYQQFRQSGALGRPLGAQRSVTEQVMGWQPTAPTVGGRMVQRGLHGLDYMQRMFLDPVETGVKNATFQTLRKRGFQPLEAAAETRLFGGSPDFQRYGIWTKNAQNVYMFINPQVQGIASSLRQFKDHPGQMAKWGTVLMAGMLGLTAWNESFVDPETGQRDFDKIPWDVKKSNLLVAVPDWEILPDELKKQTVSTGDQRRVFLKIPLAYEAQMLLAPAMAAMQGERDPNYTAAQGVLDVAQTALPGGVPLKADDLPRTAWRRLVAGMNPILRLPAELWAEENAMTGAPIEGRRVSDRVPFERYTVRTPMWARDLGRAAYQSGFPIQSPEKITHLLTGLFPGVGETAISALGTAISGDPLTESGVRGPVEQLGRTPLIGSVARRFLEAGPVDQERMQLMDQFYTLAEQTKQAATTFSQLYERDPAEWERFAQMNPQAAELADINVHVVKLQNQLSDYDKWRQELVSNPQLPFTPEQRQFYMAQIRERELADLQEAAAALKYVKERGLF